MKLLPRLIGATLVACSGSIIGVLLGLEYSAELWILAFSSGYATGLFVGMTRESDP